MTVLSFGCEFLEMWKKGTPGEYYPWPGEDDQLQDEGAREGVAPGVQPKTSGSVQAGAGSCHGA